jgi:hypothetical protein
MARTEKAMRVGGIVDGPPLRRLAVALALALAMVPVVDGGPLAMAAPAADGYGPVRLSEQPPGLKVTSSPPRQSAPASAMQERLLTGERLSPNPAGLKRMKEAAEKASRSSRGGTVDSPSLERALSAARSASAAATVRPLASVTLEGAVAAPAPAVQGDVGIAGVPTTIISSLGQSDPGFSPSDAVIAAGTTRYIQLANSRFGIYAYNSGTPIAQGTLAELAGTLEGNPFRPQIIWDADTNRFYYAAWMVSLASQENFRVFGFSKTASPASAADFCTYFFSTGDHFLNTVTLGDTQNRLLIGNQVLDNSTGQFLGTEVFHIAKPPAGTTCPDDDSFAPGLLTDLRTPNDVRAHSLVIANQIDGSTTGYAISSTEEVFVGSVTKLTVYKLTENGAAMSMQVADLTVPMYEIPDDAEQPESTIRLDTGAAGPTQAVSAIDPTRGGVVGLWTQHTVLGGAGASVRWYEINPATPSLLQGGAIAAPGVYFFNAAISPDRVAVGATRRFGGNMALGFNASAAGLKASIITASKVGAGAIGYKFVAQSPAVLNDSTCVAEIQRCLWGSYAGASPAPINVPSWTQGLVVHTTNFADEASGVNDADWGTLNMYIVPQ